MTKNQPSTAGAAVGSADQQLIRVGLIGSGWIGTFHGETLAQRIPGARLEAVADPVPGAAERLAALHGVTKTFLDADDLLADPEVDAVVIASPAFTHTDLVVAAARAGKSVFVEKPMALTLEDADRAIAAAQDAGVVLQTGFNRRFSHDFAAAGRAVKSGRVGTPQMLRSLTRDPGLANPGAVRPWTIFNETLIHDFDTLNWLNDGARPVEVTAFADALVAPDFKDGGLLDTAIVTIRYDNGALATAEASFSASYGYDVRGEVFGDRGMATAGDVRSTSMRLFGAEGEAAETTRLNIDLFHQAYTDELATFVHAIRTGTLSGPGGEDARAALVLALAARASVERNGVVRLDAEGRVA